MDPSRRAFLGRAAGASGIALTTPWCGPWLRKFFGPSGHIHDMKVRTYPKGWENLTYHTGDGQTLSWTDIRREALAEPTLDQMMVARSNGRVDLPFTNRVASDDDPWGACSIDFGPVTSINVARPDQKQLELKVQPKPLTFDKNDWLPKCICACGNTMRGEEVCPTCGVNGHGRPGIDPKTLHT